MDGGPLLPRALRTFWLQSCWAVYAGATEAPHVAASAPTASAASLFDPCARMTCFGGRDGAPYSLASVLAATVALFLPRGMAGTVAHKARVPFSYTESRFAVSPCGAYVYTGWSDDSDDRAAEEPPEFYKVALDGHIAAQFTTSWRPEGSYIFSIACAPCGTVVYAVALDIPEHSCFSIVVKECAYAVYMTPDLQGKLCVTLPPELCRQKQYSAIGVDDVHLFVMQTSKVTVWRDGACCTTIAAPKRHEFLALCAVPSSVAFAVLMAAQRRKETTMHVRLYSAEGAVLRHIGCPSLGTFSEDELLLGMIAASPHGEIAVAAREEEDSPRCVLIVSLDGRQSLTFEQHRYIVDIGFCNKGLVGLAENVMQKLYFFQ